uniref:hypothetical protein n=1 Tax=Candidatus Electronema sp. TaxID=2698783 RepID=UPI0040578566
LPTLSIMSVFHDVHAVTAAASVSDDFLYHHPILTHHLLFCHYRKSLGFNTPKKLFLGTCQKIALGT